MFSSLPMLALSVLPLYIQITTAQSSSTTLFPAHNITRSATIKFENLAVRRNGQILATSTFPNASIYQVDPLDILPPTLIYNIPNITSALGITEGEPNIFYVASGDISLTSPSSTTPQSYSITELDVRGVYVFPNGTLSRQPQVKRVASLPNAILPNGVAFAAPHSHHLLVADSIRGLIWNVDIQTGAVGVTLNDTTTKGPTLTGSGSVGVNGIKVHNHTIYWTNTGASKLYKVPVDEKGCVPAGAVPILVTSDLSCDDFVLDHKGNAYVAGPLDIVTKVSPNGGKQIIAGTFNSTMSDIIGPTAIRFGRLVSDRWSIYVTTNGGVPGVAPVVPGSAGVSRIDLGDDC